MSAGGNWRAGYREEKRRDGRGVKRVSLRLRTKSKSAGSCILILRIIACAALQNEKVPARSTVRFPGAF